jgi:uncharacterized protein (DUF2141 family)
MLMNRMQSLLLAALLPFLALAAPVLAQGPKARLTVHVQGVLAKGGLVRLGLYDRTSYDKDGEPVASADVAAKAGETVITLTGVAPGDYAVETYQDVNANEKMDQNWIGLPLEPYGFSRDAKPFLSRPGFDDVKVTLTAGENSQTVHLQNAAGK